MHPDIILDEGHKRRIIEDRARGGQEEIKG
jgi:hypothetical protein